MKKYLFYLLLPVGLISCEEESSPLFDQESFTKIYDNSFFNTAFHAQDIQQTSDEGYLILASKRLEDSNFSGIYLMKADKSGEFVKGIDIEPAQAVNATGQLMNVNGEHYFFCMNETSLNTQLAKVDEALTADSIQMITLGGMTYPSAAAKDGDNGFVMLTFNHVDKLSVFSRVSPAGEISDVTEVSIGVGDDVEEPIINHFFQTGRKFPFFVGKTSSGAYYFNGFYDYTFSLVFVNSGSVTGSVQGQHDDGGFSALTPISGNKFAGARFNYGDNYVMPQLELATSGTETSTDLAGNSLPELASNAKVKIVQTVINGKNMLVYASDTRSKQIGLLFYDEADGTFYGTHYLGFSNPFELGSVIQTEDEGLAVCGTTYLAGRFPRICLFKLSKEELAKNIN